MEEIIVLSTTETEDLARKIAAAVVGANEAACVNIIPGIRSVYRWEGKVCDEGEFLLVIKTTAGKFEALKSRIRGLHTYQLPEIVAIPIVDGDPDYLRWIRESASAI